MPTDLLTPLFEADGSDPEHLGPDQLAALSKRVSTAHPDEFILSGARAPGLDSKEGQERPADYFEIHNRDWWIDTRRPGNRDHLLSLVVSAAIVDALGRDETLGWTAQVLPALLTIESASIDEAGVHLSVRRRSIPTLPEELADDIHPLDFADFATALAGAAAAVPLPAGGSVIFVDG